VGSEGGKALLELRKERRARIPQGGKGSEKGLSLHHLGRRRGPGKVELPPGRHSAEKGKRAHAPKGLSSHQKKKIEARPKKKRGRDYTCEAKLHRRNHYCRIRGGKRRGRVTVIGGEERKKKRFDFPPFLFLLKEGRRGMGIIERRKRGGSWVFVDRKPEGKKKPGLPIRAARKKGRKKNNNKKKKIFVLYDGEKT